MYCKHTRLDLVTWKCRYCGVHVDMSAKEQEDYAYAEARATNEATITVISGQRWKAYPSGHFEPLGPFPVPAAGK